jgi:3-keto-disaccharide hydrolase
MKRHWTAAAAAALLAFGCAQMQRMTGMGWETLIDGDKGLENFNQVGDANWRAEGGAIVADQGKSGFLVSKKSYKDFQIRAEFYAEADTNSGIYIRCNNRQKLVGNGAETCYEVNIWDARPDPKYGTGAIVDVAAVPVPLQNKAGGHWNTYEVTATGPQMTVRLNGVQTASGQNGKLSEGPIGLQYAPGGAKGTQGGPIKWRKVQIRPL